ncbi:sigma-70 family RNA polymerase sigma factor [Leptolyngbya sp. FACHB-17]|uniref:sigma-70 family RNA polymerase sigma factor n=1 Tax=unclassified Leptolyngbya TaxID=2650499 RepID=UPI0016807A5B|nr:sigma-70 family RNA polymerase sigma factor [Leptolyngbya sp. FACHB-17]MBD2078445.1 sigma-70 family RNA polymerase sigma factor [Leptolyngbya sp. FACHB-17]
MNDSEKDCQRRALDEVMDQILSQDSPHAYSIITMVRHYIQQFKLDSHVEPADILHEAYLRGLRATDQGTRITSCRPWIKGTARYIVLERSRQRRRELPTDPQAAVLDTLSESGDRCEESRNHNFTIFLKVLERYRSENPRVAELMDWRFLEKLSWSAIRKRLLERDGEAPSEEALRQRATRAKRELRRLFHESGGEYEPLRQL